LLGRSATDGERVVPRRADGNGGSRPAVRSGDRRRKIRGLGLRQQAPVAAEVGHPLEDSTRPSNNQGAGKLRQAGFPVVQFPQTGGVDERHCGAVHLEANATQDDGVLDPAVEFRPVSDVELASEIERGARRVEGDEEPRVHESLDLAWRARRWCSTPLGNARREPSAFPTPPRVGPPHPARVAR
jgi:hypothetical protein